MLGGMGGSRSNAGPIPIFWLPIANFIGRNKETRAEEVNLR